MKEIQLTQGKVTKVSDEDYDDLMKYKWQYDLLSNGKDGYARRWNPDGSNIRMHRHILGLTDPSIYVDHIDRDKLNNQRENLRIATFAQNSQNVPKSKENPSSKYKGVTKRINRWIARCGNGEGGYIYIGTFATEQEAAEAYNKKVLEVYGEGCFLNIIENI